MEHLSVILSYVFGSTTVVSIIGFFIYYRYNKRLKESEAKQAESGAEQTDIETQKQKIDLGNKFIEDSLALMEKIKQSQDTGNENQQRILIKIDKVEDKVDDIVTYLNGDFQDYLKRNHKVHYQEERSDITQ